MKKTLVVSLLLIIAATSVIGCSSKDTNDKESVKNNVNVEESKDVFSTKENLFNIEVTLPSNLFENQDMSAIEQEAKANGVHDVKINDDGSVTYKMDKSTHKNLLKELKSGVDESIEEALNDKEAFRSFSEITYNDDLTEFNILVDASLFNPFEGISALGYYLMGNMYQAMNCVKTEDINTTVNFINKDTKEIIESGNSKDLVDTE